MKKEKFYILKPEKNSKWVGYTFAGIIIFTLIYVPFFAVNIRYQLGAAFLKIFDTIGWVCLTTGSALTIACLLSLFTGRLLRFKYFIVGITLLWVGCWCTGNVLTILGITLGNETSNTGYH